MRPCRKAALMAVFAFILCLLAGCGGHGYDNDTPVDYMPDAYTDRV